MLDVGLPPRMAAFVGIPSRKPRRLGKVIEPWDREYRSSSRITSAYSKPTLKACLPRRYDRLSLKSTVPSGPRTPVLLPLPSDVKPPVIAIVGKPPKSGLV